MFETASRQNPALEFHSSLQLRAALGLQAFASQLAAPGPGGLLLPPLEVTHFLVADTADFVAVQFNTPGTRMRAVGGLLDGEWLTMVLKRHTAVFVALQLAPRVSFRGVRLSVVGQAPNAFFRHGNASFQAWKCQL